MSTRTSVAAHSGELIREVVGHEKATINHGIRQHDHVYPTLTQVNQQAGFEPYSKALRAIRSGSGTISEYGDNTFFVA
ncbi:MAG: hypothetical protein ACR2IB_12095 [Pyrinomonadaceae bacterium]